MQSQTRPTHRHHSVRPFQQQQLPRSRGSIPIERPHHLHSGHTAFVRPVLSIRARVDRREAAEYISEALRDIRAYIDEHHLKVGGAPFTLYHSAEGDELDIEAGWPLTRYAEGTSRIRAGELPTTMLRHTDRTPTP